MPARKHKRSKCVGATVNTISANGTVSRYPGLLPEPRPAGARTVALHSRFPSQAEVTRLVRDLGYCPSSALACIYRAVPNAPDRRARKVCPSMDSKDAASQETHVRLSHPDHPYIAASARRTSVGGGYTREQITHAIGEMRLSKEMSEVLYQFNVCNGVAEILAACSGLKVKTVYNANVRLKERLKRKTA